MTRGMYTSATGMLANQTALDVVSQNLANANTKGYKQDIPEFQSFNDTLLSRMNDTAQGPSVGSLGQGAGVQSLTTDFSQGSFQKTDQPLDVALTGDAALVVQTAQGVRLTRDGELTRSTQGLLVQTNGGATVLGQNGQPISIPSGAGNIVISPTGQISADGKVLGQMRLAGISRTSGATKIGDNLFSQATMNAPSAGASVKQGYLEMSNVSVIKAMVSMIAVNRSYETNEKMLKSEDDATGKAVSDVAKL